jgi:hypothetical protein
VAQAEENIGYAENFRFMDKEEKEFVAASLKPYARQLMYYKG